MNKLKLYQRFGVKEYWMVSLEEQSIMILTLNEEGIYQITQSCYLDEEVKVNVLENCFINLKEFCEDNNIIIKKDKMYQMLMEEEAKNSNNK